MLVNNSMDYSKKGLPRLNCKLTVSKHHVAHEIGVQDICTLENENVLTFTKKVTILLKFLHFKIAT